MCIMKPHVFMFYSDNLFLLMSDFIIFRNGDDYIFRLYCISSLVLFVSFFFNAPFSSSLTFLELMDFFFF